MSIFWVLHGTTEPLCCILQERLAAIEAIGTYAVACGARLGMNMVPKKALGSHGQRCMLLKLKPQSEALTQV